MPTLLVGFDSAWTASKAGAIVGCVRLDDSSLRELGEPRIVNFADGADTIVEWQRQEGAISTLILLDQPTIVKNATGQRPIENIVSSVVSRRHGGMQPANTGKSEMFGAHAPVWSFLARFGGATDPCGPKTATIVLETYPVLAMIAMGWTLPDHRPKGRLPKYNPDRRKTFSVSDWSHVCRNVSAELRGRRLGCLANWVDAAALLSHRRKCDQDKLDACLCLLVALWLAEGKNGLMVGNIGTGYLVVPYADDLHEELQVRCRETNRSSVEWLRVFRLPNLSRPSITGS